MERMTQLKQGGQHPTGLSAFSAGKEKSMDRELLELIGAVCAVDESSGVPPSFYVMEECAELIKEIMKDQRGKGDREKIVDEACDVLTTAWMKAWS